MDFRDNLDLIQDFIEDVGDLVDQLESHLLPMEEDIRLATEVARLNEILGILHTLKGNSGMMGYASLQQFAHRLEDLFKGFQKGQPKADVEAIALIIEGMGAIRLSVAGLTDDVHKLPDLDAERSRLESFLKMKTKPDKNGPDSGGKLESPTPNPAIPEISTDDTGAVLVKKTNVLKVDFKRLDQILNLMGELVIHRTRLGQLGNEFTQAFGEKGLCLELGDTVEQIGKVTTELHEAIMRARMLPISHVLRRFPRFIRDLAHEKKKSIQLKFEGEETELDKTVIDEIGEPLMHMLRNAIDHGIETPEERLSHGKSPQGTITIRASQESNLVIIVVEDDGRGIDMEKIRASAEKFGIANTEPMIDRQLQELIFAPGFSTAEVVSETSGRGIGMDVVKKSLAKINGSIEVETALGEGTRFTIKLPLTLAIISALMVRSAGRQYAVPLNSVVESLDATDLVMHSIHDRKVLKIRDRILPVIELSQLFQFQSSTDSRKKYLIVVHCDQGQIGLVVDALLGRQEIVVKALDDYLGDSMGVAGATILGDGGVVLILDIPMLVEKMQMETGVGKYTSASEVRT